MMEFKHILETNPVIPAVKNMQQLERALETDAQVIFVLFGDILTLTEISEKIKVKDKLGILHIDLVEGLSSKEIALEYLSKFTSFKGVISTKPSIIRAAKKMGFVAVQRVFILDTISLKNVKTHFIDQCDAIEMLPGLLYPIIKELSGAIHKPLIAGGLISEKDSVLKALKMGAISISTSTETVWDI